MTAWTAVSTAVLHARYSASRFSAASEAPLPSDDVSRAPPSCRGTLRYKAAARRLSVAAARSRCCSAVRSTMICVRDREVPYQMLSVVIWVVPKLRLIMLFLQDTIEKLLLVHLQTLL